MKVDAEHAGRLLVEAVPAGWSADGHRAAGRFEPAAEVMDAGVRMVAAAVIDKQDPHAAPPGPGTSPLA